MGHLVTLVSDVGDLSQLNPDKILALTDRVSHSMLDVSNLTKSAHLSLSTPSLVASGVWSKLTKKRAKAADSKTHLLRSSDGFDNSGYVESEGVSLLWRDGTLRKTFWVSVLLVMVSGFIVINISSFLVQICFDFKTFSFL